MGGNPKKWDVILVRYPYTDGSTTKRRPGVIAAVVINDFGGEDIIIAAITSTRGPRGIEVPVTHEELSITGLHSDSRILPGKLFTCAKSEIDSIIGRLGPKLLLELKNRMRAILDL